MLRHGYPAQRKSKNLSVTDFCTREMEFIGQEPARHAKLCVLKILALDFNLLVVHTLAVSSMALSLPEPTLMQNWG